MRSLRRSVPLLAVLLAAACSGDPGDSGPVPLPDGSSPTDSCGDGTVDRQEACDDGKPGGW